MSENTRKRPRSSFSDTSNCQTKRPNSKSADLNAGGSRNQPGKGTTLPIFREMAEAKLGIRAVKPDSFMKNGIIQSPNDTRIYRTITLPNGLRALLISDLKEDSVGSDSSSTENVGSSTEASTTENSERKGASVSKTKDEKSDEFCTGSETTEGESRKGSNVGCDSETLSESSAAGPSAAGPSAAGPSAAGSSAAGPSAAGRKGRSSRKDKRTEVEEDESEDDDDDSDEDDDDDSDDDHSSTSDGSEEEKEGAKMKTKPEGRQKLAAAALCVGIGSFAGPHDIHGLAHFLEHMVFMGSEKYPDENAFDAFIKKAGGMANAYTECEQTCFHFDVENSKFKEALDIFAEFFISPLMKREAIEREIEAIESEFNMAAPKDSARKQSLLGSLAVNDSPLSRFLWGNEKSLKTVPEERNMDVYSRLKEFFHRYYSAHYMTLVVMAKESCDTLQDWVMEIFSRVPANMLPKPDFSRHEGSLDTPAFSSLLKVIPMKNVHRLELTWQLPPMLQHYRCKPLLYLGWLTGHEGEGSIMSALKRRLWGLAMCGGTNECGWEMNSINSLFSITVTLTELGLEKVMEVATIVFEYLSMLRRTGPQKRIYEEIKIIEDNEFRWKSQTEPADYVEELSVSMQLYEQEHYLTGDSLLMNYDPEIITQCLECMIPQKANIMILSKKFEDSVGDFQEEEHFSVRYVKEEVPAQWRRAWQGLSPRPELKLPQKNTYIAEDFTLLPSPSVKPQHPVMLLNTDTARLWYKQDTKFKVPRAYVYFHLVSSCVSTSARSLTLSDIFIDVLSHNLQEVAYSAHVAQLEYTFTLLSTGVVIGVSGFSDKLHRLFETIIDHIANFYVTEETFNVILAQRAKNYYNRAIKPSCLVKDIRLRLIRSHYWTTVERKQFLKTVKKEDLMGFVYDFKRTLFVEGFVQGNLSEQNATAYMRYVADHLQKDSLPGNLRPQPRSVCLPEGTECVCRVKGFNEKNANTVVCNFYQGEPCSIRGYILNELLVSVMDEPCFDVLRTKEQLGYDVSCTMGIELGVAGIILRVSTHANKYSAEYVNLRIEKFLKSIELSMKDYPHAEFKGRITSLVALKQCEDAHMGEEADRAWAEIVEQTYVFDRLDKEVEEILKVNLSDLIEWFDRVLRPTSSHYKKLSVQVVGHGQSETGRTTLESRSDVDMSIMKSSCGGLPVKPPSEPTSIKNPLTATDFNTSKIGLHTTSLNAGATLASYSAATLTEDSECGDGLGNAGQLAAEGSCSESELRFVETGLGAETTQATKKLCITNIQEFKNKLFIHPVSKVV